MWENWPRLLRSLPACEALLHARCMYSPPLHTRTLFATPSEACAAIPPVQSTVAHITARKDAEIASMRSELEASQAALAEVQAQLEQAQAATQVLPFFGLPARVHLPVHL